ncbi:MAG: hypothetical protein U9O94_10395 [Nanoarchaeota archaeon]|nr:hypothetical protein [Nanoarchaeota archaeon]
MKKENFRNNWIEEFESLKNLVIKEFSEDGFRNLKENSAKLATYHYNKRKLMLLGEERKLYNFLIENSYNPYRVYRWFLLERVPDDVRFQLRNRLISQKIASKIHFKRKHESKNKVCLEIKLMGINLVRSM